MSERLRPAVSAETLRANQIVDLAALVSSLRIAVCCRYRARRREDICVVCKNSIYDTKKHYDPAVEAVSAFGCTLGNCCKYASAVLYAENVVALRKIAAARS